MDWKDHIVKDPRILAGKPTVKGTRISVQLVTELLDAGVWTEADILRNYPRLTTDDLEACRLYAATGQPLGFVTWMIWKPCWTKMTVATRLSAGSLNSRNTT